jgi:site-specific DNA recombinase
LAVRRASLDGGRGRELQADEEALEQLSRDFYVHRLIGRPEFLAAREPLERKIAAARAAQSQDARLELLAELPTEEDALLALWQAKPMPWRRRVVEAMLERVEVKPAAVRGRNRIDPGRVLPDGLHWRG